MISEKNAGKVLMEVKFPLVNLFVLFVEWMQALIPHPMFRSCWVHKRCSGITGKLKGNNNYKCQTRANQQTDIAEDCQDIKLNGQSLEIVEKLCDVGDTLGIRKGWVIAECFDSVLLSTPQAYLTSKKQRPKVGTNYSLWQKILPRVPQGPILYSIS